MYKILSGVLLFILLTIGTLFLLLFTNTGNAFLRPYINSYIAKNYDIDAHLSSFTLRPNFLDMEVYLYKNIRVVLNGDINIWKESFDLDLMVNAKDISTKYAKIKGSTKIDGKVIGDIKHIKIDGKGDIFNSLVRFDSIVDNFKAKNLHLFMKKARIAKLLTLIDKPPYVSGVADIDVNFDDLNPSDLKGSAKIDIPYGSVNSMLVKKDFNITLPIGFIFKAKSSTILKRKDTLSSINFDSNILKLNTVQTIYNLKDKTFQSDYSLIIPNLALLKSVTKQNLRGNFKATGKIKKDNDGIGYLISTFSFGGNLKAVGYNKKLQINATNLRLDKILFMLNKPKYSYGDIQINSFLDNIGSEDMSGDINVTLDKGMPNRTILQKDFNITVPKDIKYNIVYNAKIKENNMKYDTEINSTIADISVTDGIANLKDLKTKAKYSVKIADLSKLYFITKQELVGNTGFKGDFSYFDDIFLLNGTTDIFDTNTTYTYKNGDITIKSLGISVAKISQIFNYPPFFDANGTADIYYNPKWKKGNFSVKLNDGHIIQNELSDTVLMLSGFDITQELYQNSLLQGTIQADTIKFVYDMNSSNTLFKIYSAVADLKTQSIDAPFILKIKDKDIQGEIKGDLHHPKVEIKTSSYIKNKLEKVIDKKVPKKFQEPLKQILNLFGG